jgi:anaerobic dimethyl sulfoxide reductase subunit B (iron-sulfur subunit)
MVDEERCDGCGSCVARCPYGAISLLQNGKAGKCDLCVDLLAAGEMPACAGACVTRALKLRSLGEWEPGDEERMSEYACT